MTGKTHAVIGLNVVWLLKLTTLSFNPIVIPLAGLAALLPDLDASESTIKHLSFPLGSGRRPVRIKLFYPLAVVMSKLFRHRGWLHSGVAILIVAAVSTVTLSRFGIEFPLIITAGYASHLLSDALTISGIQFFLPVPNWFHLLPRPLRIKTGGAFDMMLFVVGALGFAMLIKMVSA